VSLFLLSGSLHLRGQEAPFYGHGELAGHESTMWQLELAAQMKIGALTILTLIVAAFAVSGDARRTAARVAERATRNGQACTQPRADFVCFHCCPLFSSCTVFDAGAGRAAGQHSPRSSAASRRSASAAAAITTTVCQRVTRGTALSIALLFIDSILSSHTDDFDAFFSTPDL